MACTEPHYSTLCSKNMAPRFSSFSSPLLIMLLGFIVYIVDGTDQILSARFHVDLKTLHPRDSCSPSVKGL